MSADRYKVLRDKCKELLKDDLLRMMQQMDADCQAGDSKGATLGSLIRSLQIVERVVGSDVEVFIRDKDGIHPPQVVIERTPNELPVDVIVTIR